MPYGKKSCPGGGRTCPEIISTSKAYCEAHAREHEQRRGRRQQRGYDAAHDRLRKQWAPIVATGFVKCSRCRELIDADEPWDLGHDDHDRSKYTGPEHVHCNRATAGRDHSPAPF